MPPNPVHQLNRAVCQADSTYSMTVKEIRIVDTGKGSGTRSLRGPLLARLSSSSCHERHCLPLYPDQLPGGKKKTSGLTLEKILEAIRPWLLRSTGHCPYCHATFPEMEHPRSEHSHSGASNAFTARSER